MSFDYWPIVGYGVQIRETEFDSKKVEQFLERIDKPTAYIDDLLDEITANTSYTWVSTGNMYKETVYCIMLIPVFPWEAYVNKTPEMVEKEIITLVMPFLVERTELKAGEILDVGCG